MDIRVTSTNKIFYEVDSQLAAILCEALPSVFERLQKPAAQPVKPAVPRYGITQLFPSGYYAVQRIWGPETAHYDQWPHQLLNLWSDCPLAIEKEYTRLFVYRQRVHPVDNPTIEAFEAHKKKVLG